MCVVCGIVPNVDESFNIKTIERKRVSEHHRLYFHLFFQRKTCKLLTLEVLPGLFKCQIVWNFEVFCISGWDTWRSWWNCVYWWTKNCAKCCAWHSSWHCSWIDNLSMLKGAVMGVSLFVANGSALDNALCVAYRWYWTWYSKWNCIWIHTWKARDRYTGGYSWNSWC